MIRKTREASAGTAGKLAIALGVFCCLLMPLASVAQTQDNEGVLSREKYRFYMGNTPTFQKGDEAASAYYEQGRKGFELGHYKLAMASFRRSIRALDYKRSTESRALEFVASAYYAIAVCHSMLVQPDSAAHYLEKVLNIEPQHEEATLEMARLLLKIEQWEEARPLLETGMSRYTKNPYFVYYYALCIEGEAGSHKARKFLERIIRKRPDHAILYALLAHYQEAYEQPGKSRRSLKKARQLDSSSAYIPYKQGEWEVMHGTAENAVEYYRQSLALDSLSPETYGALGRVYLLQRSYTEGFCALQHAVRLQELNADGEFPGYWRGELYELIQSACRGEASTAEMSLLADYYQQSFRFHSTFKPQLARFLTQNEGSSFAHRLSLYANLSRLGPEAIENRLLNILSLDSTVYTCNMLYGRLLREQGRFSEALVYLDRALEQKPKHTGLLVRRGQVLAQLNRPDEALWLLNKAIAGDAIQIEALAERAQVYMHQRQFQLAAEDLQTIVKLIPKTTRFENMLAQCYLELNKKQEALTVITNSIEHGPATGNNFYLLAVIQALDGNKDGALENFREAVRLDTTSHHIHRTAIQYLLQEGYSNEAYNLAGRIYRRQPGNFENAWIFMKCATSNNTIPPTATGEKQQALFHLWRLLEADSLVSAIDRSWHYRQDSLLAACFFTEGVARMRLHDLENARIAMDSCLSLCHKNATALYQRGELYFLEEKYRAALQYFQRALTANPMNTDARYGCAKASWQLGHWDSCLSYLQQLHSLSGSIPPTLLALIRDSKKQDDTGFRALITWLNQLDN